MSQIDPKYSLLSLPVNSILGADFIELEDFASVVADLFWLNKTNPRSSTAPKLIAITYGFLIFFLLFVLFDKVNQPSRYHGKSIVD
jgi:hypothetical protein